MSATVNASGLRNGFGTGSAPLLRAVVPTSLMHDPFTSRPLMHLPAVFDHGPRAVLCLDQNELLLGLSLRCPADLAEQTIHAGQLFQPASDFLAVLLHAFRPCQNAFGLDHLFQREDILPGRHAMKIGI